MLLEINEAQKYITGKYGNNPNPGTYAVPTETSKGPAFMRVILSGPELKMSSFDLFKDETLTEKMEF